MPICGTFLRPRGNSRDRRSNFFPQYLCRSHIDIDIEHWGRCRFNRGYQGLYQMEQWGPGYFQGTHVVGRFLPFSHSGQCCHQSILWRMIRKNYQFYKGLQKPLIYRGFKGKFIYYAVVSIMGGMLSGGLVGAFTNMVFGCLCILVFMTAGMVYTISKQKKGLFDKTHHRGIFIHPSKILFKNEKTK